VVVLPCAESLLPEVVGHAPFQQPIEYGLGADDVGRLHVADADDKPVALEVAAPQLVVVPVGPEQVEGQKLETMDALVLERLVLPRQPDGKVLPGHRVLVFHPRVADVRSLDLVQLGESADDVGGGHRALLDEQVEMFTAAARRVQRQFLDQKVLGLDFDASADARQVRRQVREFGGDGGDHLIGDF